MARSRATLKVLTTLIILGAIGWGTWMRLRPPPEEEEEGTEEQTTEPATAADAVAASVRQQFNTELPVPVTGAVAVQDTLRISVTAKGRAEPIRQAKLKARKSGIVARVRVRENQVVRAGELLVQIDTTEYALALAAQAAALRRAQAEYQVRVLGDEEITDLGVRAARDSLARAFTGLDQAEVDYRPRRQGPRGDRGACSVRGPCRGRQAGCRTVRGRGRGSGHRHRHEPDEGVGPGARHRSRLPRRGARGPGGIHGLPRPAFHRQDRDDQPAGGPGDQHVPRDRPREQRGRPHIPRHVRRGRPGGAEIPRPAPGAQDGHSGGHRRAPLPLRGRRGPRQLALRASRNGKRPTGGTPHDRGEHGLGSPGRDGAGGRTSLSDP